jgi:1A family penicillin-binding protein
MFLSLAAPAPAQNDFVSCPPLPADVSSITVVDRQGKYVGRILPQKRYWVSIDHIPAFLQQAVVAVEDARFYEHGGIDLRGIARALVKDVTKGALVEGGSTITQQLIKNKYLSSERSLDRKLKEARMAMEFEKKYTKRQILEMYFNEIYYGHGAQGLVQAARLYFDKRPEELNENECVLLAGVPKNPGKYNPLGRPEDVASRRNVVLGRLTELKLVTPRQRQAILKRPSTTRDLGQAPQYMAHIRAKLIERYGADIVEQGGLDVTAALDLNLQKQAEQILKDGVKRRSPDLQGALICMDTATGNVLAAVGDVNGNANSLNRAFASKRQPGSAVKPFIYALAMERGMTASSIWNDAPATYDRGNGSVWKPMNYGREQYGYQSLRQALAYSNNIITVKLLDALGVSSFTDFSGRMGLPMHAQNGLSLALGTEEVTLNDLVQAYTPFATGGLRVEARTILKIYDRRHRAWKENPPVIYPVLSSGAAYVTTQMMKDVLVYGTAKGLRRFSQGHPSAGKTGTTDNWADAWFVGYTPQVITGVWVGYDRPRPGGGGFTGGAVAAPIWEQFMRRAVASRPVEDFPEPASVVSVTIDPTTGHLATEGCPKTHDEYYIRGTQPTEYCTKHEGAPLMPPLPEEPPSGLPAEGQPEAPPAVQPGAGAAGTSQPAL